MKIKITILFLLLTSAFYAQSVKTIVSGANFTDGLAIDGSGNVYASNYMGDTVVKIKTDGSTEVFASGFVFPNGLSFGPDGYLYVSNAFGGKIDKVSPSGDVTNVLSGINNPANTIFDSAGNMYIAFSENNEIGVYSAGNGLSTFISGSDLKGPIGMAFDVDENFYFSNFTDGKIFKRVSDGTVSEIADLPGFVGFIAYSSGYIFATSFNKNVVYKVNIDGSGFEVFAGTGDKGSLDGDVTSSTFNAPNGICTSLSGDSLYVSEFNNQSLRLIDGLGIQTDVEYELEQPLEFTLEQNYPNPFNPSTRINYYIPEEDHVELNLYSIEGKLVEALVNETKGAGLHTLVFNSKNLSSGVYIYKLLYNGQSKSKKLILVK